MNRIVFAIGLVLLGALSQHHCLAESVGADSSGPSALEMTIRRYFASQSGYQKGDLVTRSQVAELQVYLRKTRRRGPACHPLVLQRMLPDDCRIAKLFYSKNRGNVLRVASQKLGGYAVIEALTRSTASYTQLAEAADSESVEAVVQLAVSAGLNLKDKTAKTKGRKGQQKRIIYTLEEFLIAIKVAPETKIPTNDSQQPTP